MDDQLNQLMDGAAGEMLAEARDSRFSPQVAIALKGRRRERRIRQATVAALAVACMSIFAVMLVTMSRPDELPQPLPKQAARINVNPPVPTPPPSLAYLNANIRAGLGRGVDIASVLNEPLSTPSSTNAGVAKVEIPMSPRSVLTGL